MDKVMKKILKKNQIIIYIIALMLVTAGYLNFTTTTQNADIATSMQMESTDDMQLADIGDAQLVSSNDVVSESTENGNNNEETRPPEGNNQGATGGTTEENTGNTTNPGNNEPTEELPETLPKTGTTQYVYIITALAVLSCAYIAVKNMKKDK